MPKKLFALALLFCICYNANGMNFPLNSDENVYIQNPVISDYTVHDVSLIRYKNAFYAFASCVVHRDKMKKLNYVSVQIFKSTNLVDWEYYKQATFDDYKNELYASDEAQKKYQIWAPDIIRYKDKLLLFVAFRHTFDDSLIAVFESDDISHDFVFKNVVVSNNKRDARAFFPTREIIDPYPFVYKNKLFLVFGSFSRNDKGKMWGNRKGIGTYIVPLVYGDEISMKGEPVFISDYYEGVNIQRHGNYFFLFGTNGVLSNHTYKIDYAKSKNIMGPYKNANRKQINDTVNINLGTPILYTRNAKSQFNGFGCLSNMITDNDGRTFVLVHGHDLNKKPIQMKTPQSERYAFLLEILWDKYGNPYFDMDAIQNNGIKKPTF